MQFAGYHLQRDHPAAGTVVHMQRGGEPLFVDFDAGFEDLIVQRHEQRLAGDVADEIGARLRCAAECARAELAVGAAIKNHAHVLELDHVARRLLAHHLDRVLIGEVIAAFNRVERVRFPTIRLADGGVNTALGGTGVTADRVHFRDDCHVGTIARCLKRGAHAR